MRSVLNLSFFLVAAQAAGEQFSPTGGKSLEEAYGPVVKVKETVSWSKRGRSAKPDGYFDVRNGDNCTFPLEVYIVQDETGSFSDNFIQMKETELKNMYDVMHAHHQGSTFGFGSFRDKPIWTLGEPKTDFCWKFQLPLQSDWKTLHDAFGKLVSVGGGDAPEYQFGSIIAATQSNTPGWSNPIASRLVVVSTDAQPHFEGDGHNAYGLKPYSGSFDEANPSQQCKEQYYPHPDQVKTALEKRETYAAFLVFDGDYNQGGKPIDAWKWFNSHINQSDDFVENVQRDAHDWWMKLSSIIKSIENIECRST